MVLSETSTLVEFEPTAISGCTRGHTVRYGPEVPPRTTSHVILSREPVMSLSTQC